VGPPPEGRRRRLRQHCWPLAASVGVHYDTGAGGRSGPLCMERAPSFSVGAGFNMQTQEPAAFVTPSNVPFMPIKSPMLFCPRGD
jgi:hypothetical protein